MADCSHKETEIKGPNLQHRLNVLRLWRCPKCSRTVRTRGAVTTRLCRCSDPASLMQIVDEPRYPKFDPTPFVSYDNEQDATPTEAELVEDLPERQKTAVEIAAAEQAGKPRRGKGYLRAEIDESDPSAATTDTESAEPAADFGAGIEEDNASPQAGVIAPPDTEEPKRTRDESSVEDSAGERTATDSDSETEGKPRSRRRRRPRRRGRDRKRTDSESSDSGNAAGDRPKADESAPASAQNEPAATGDANDTDGAGEKSNSGRRRRPRRRNRRRRGKGGDAGGSGGSEQTG